MGKMSSCRPVSRQAGGVACAALVILLLVPVSANAGVRVSPAVADGGPTTVVISAPVAGETSPQIATGEYHTCALLTDGTVRCWGLGTGRSAR